jgi:MFS family permease
MTAVLVSAVASLPTLRSADWSLTSLPRVDSATPLGAAAHAIDPGFHTVHTGAYDGQFYWGIAVDPVARGAVHAALDKPSYRYGHPLYGWLGWLVSAGRPRLAPAALAAVGLVSILAAASAAAALGVVSGRSGWQGLFVALNPGLISSVVHDLAEPLATALLFTSLVMYVRGRRVAAWAGFALLPLAKEPLALVLLALVAWELWHRRRRRALVFASAIAPALIWWTYLRLELGGWFTSGDSALGSPLEGWREAFLHLSGHPASSFTGMAVATVFVGLSAMLLYTAVTAVRRHGHLDLAYLALFIVAVCLAANATLALTTALRNTAFLIALVPFILLRGDPIARLNEA